MPITNHKLLFTNIINFYLTILIPLLYFLILYLIYATPNTFPPYYMTTLPHDYISITSLIIAILGILLWLTCYYYLRSSFGVLPKTPKNVVKSGPYKYFNHPMYIAIFLTFTGLALANQSLPGLLANLFILTPINILRAYQEFKQLNKP